MVMAGCAHHSGVGTEPKPKTVHNREIGRWKNIYKGDPKLAGVEVHQFGECPYDQWLYEGKHPEAVWYYFWDGRVRQIDYEPDGKSYSDQWWPPEMRLRRGSLDWQQVDFSQGSDPTFKHHADPRKNLKSS
ncbi:hypothetical protein BH09VER1_BH09VER1_00990 [soil metagenome]